MFLHFHHILTEPLRLSTENKHTTWVTRLFLFYFNEIMKFQNSVLNKMADTNPVGRLNDYGTKHSLKIYDEYEHSGPDHSRTFICTMRLGEGREYVCRGEGKSKKESKVQAALNILAMLPQAQPQGTESSDGGDPIILNAKGSLQELCQRNLLSIPIYKTVSKKGPSHDITFSVSCCVKDINGELIHVLYGNGKNKKSAETDAALQMKQKIEALLPEITNGLTSVKTRSSNPSIKLPIEDQLQLDELLATIIGKNFNTPELLIQTSEPADVNDLSTMKHLCVALAQHCQPLQVQCSYDVATLPVASQGIGSTEEEAKREALLNLLNNIHMLGL